MSRFRFPLIRQLGLMDCGPVCLQMIGKYYGKSLSLNQLKSHANISKVGVNLLGICSAAEAVGLKTIPVMMNIEALFEDRPFPCIVHWNQNHFVVLYKLSKKYAYIADPATGLHKYPLNEFLHYWNRENETSIVLIIEPTPVFYTKGPLENKDKKTNQWELVKKNVHEYKRYFFQILFGFIATSLIIVATPFLTQAIIDNGIFLKDLNFIYLILTGQLLLFFSGAIIEILRGWLLLHIGTRINIKILSQFFSKLFKLPISFFDTHITGELMQRIDDHQKIEKLLTVDSISTLFSLLNFIILCTILLFFNPIVFAIFLTGSIFSVFWIAFFLKKRAFLDYKTFELNAKNQSKILELFKSIEEIKISNSSEQKRLEWENLQSQLFKVKLQYLSLEQKQSIGSRLIQQFVAILITIFTAKSVIDGQLSLGSMFAINMMIGQLLTPLQQIITFIPQLQDAKLSLQRINEVHVHKEEDHCHDESKAIINGCQDIILENVSFSYSNDLSETILKNINMTIPGGKTTAIVGASGGGKTTLFKLLLKFYSPSSGNIKLGANNLNQINPNFWRDQCGVVLQDGKLLSDTIINNIALGKEVDLKKIIEAVKLANISSYIEDELPLNYHTKIGHEGLQLSTGQAQRILLARAIYKSPDYILLDEATSALDTKNEKKVIENLNEYFVGKTMIVIAHRLSTVKRADQIVVLHQGEIVEIGTHDSLTEKRGYYYELVKDQLQLEQLN